MAHRELAWLFLKSDTGLTTVRESYSRASSKNLWAGSGRTRMWETETSRVQQNVRLWDIITDRHAVQWYQFCLKKQEGNPFIEPAAEDAVRQLSEMLKWSLNKILSSALGALSYSVIVSSLRSKDLGSQCWLHIWWSWPMPLWLFCSVSPFSMIRSGDDDKKQLVLLLAGLRPR